MTEHTSKAEQDRQFHFRYHRAFETKAKRKNWTIYLQYGIQLLTADTYEQRFIFELAVDSIKRTDETKNI